MSRILQQLHTDHRNTARLLNLMEQQIDILEQGEISDYGLMLDVMLYMTQYPDLYHHPREDLLFERWQSHDESATELVGTLSLEHKSIIRNSIHLLELLRRAALDIIQRRDELVTAGRQYIQHQREHMQREEMEVFPELLQVLSAQDWEAIDKLLAPQDDPLFGRVVSEQFRTRHAQIMQLIEQQ